MSLLIILHRITVHYCRGPVLTVHQPCVLHAGIGLLPAAGAGSVMAAGAGSAPGQMIFADWVVVMYCDSPARSLFSRISAVYRAASPVVSCASTNNWARYTPYWQVYVRLRWNQLRVVEWAISWLYTVASYRQNDCSREAREKPMSTFDHKRLARLDDQASFRCGRTVRCNRLTAERAAENDATCSSIETTTSFIYVARY